GAERVGERVTRDLVQIEVWRHVDVGREKVVHDLSLREVLIHKTNALGQAEPLDFMHKLVAIALSLSSLELRMGLADDEVQRVRMGSDDRRHRRDHVLESLARIDEPEGRNDRSLLDAELSLEAMPPVRRDRWHPMRYDDRRSGDAVYVSEEASGGLGHHPDDRAPLGDAAERGAHPRLGRGPVRVQGRADPLADLLEQRAP